MVELHGRERYFYAEADEELYRTDGYGGTDPDIDNITPRFTSDIDLTANLGASVDFLFDGSGAAGDLLLYLYKKNAGSWESGVIAIRDIAVTNDGTEHTYHFTIDESYGAGYYAFMMMSSPGCGDNPFEIDVQMRVWNKQKPG